MREAILMATRTASACDGYQTSLYGIARDVGVSPALVHHYFPDRVTLFAKVAIESTAGADANLMHQAASITELEPGHLGGGIMHAFIGPQDNAEADRFTAVVHAASGQGSNVEPLRDFTTTGVLSPIVTHFCPDHPQLHTQLVASQIIGLGLARRVARMDRIAGLNVKALVALVGPTIQYYAFDDLPNLADPAWVNPNPSLDRGSPSTYIHHMTKSDAGDIPRESGASSQSHDFSRDVTALASSEQLAVTVTNLRVTRGRKETLCGLDLDLVPGTITSLSDPSGYGKIILVCIVVGVQRYCGQPEVLGHAPSAAAVHGQVDYVTQDQTVYRDLTACQNLRYFTSLVGNRACDLDKVLDVVRLTVLANRPMSTCSGGGAGYVNLACTLMADPDLLVMNEPTVDLSPITREEPWITLYALAERGVTLLVSNRVMDEALRCDRVFLMCQDRILATATATNLLTSTGADTVNAAFLVVTADSEGRPGQRGGQR